MKFVSLIFLIGLVTTVWSQNECPNDFQVNVKTAIAECKDGAESEVGGSGGALFSRKVRQIIGGHRNEEGGRRERGGHHKGIFQCVYLKLQDEQFLLDIKAECQKHILEKPERCAVEKLKELCPQLSFGEAGGHGMSRVGWGQRERQFGGGHREEGEAVLVWGSHQGGHQVWGSREGGRSGDGQFGINRHGRPSHFRPESDRSYVMNGNDEADNYGNPFEGDDDEEEE